MVAISGFISPPFGRYTWSDRGRLGVPGLIMNTIIELAIVMLAPTILMSAIIELVHFHEDRSGGIVNVWRCAIQGFMVIVLLLVVILVVTLIKM